MKTVKAVIAAVVTLSACVTASLLAADPTAVPVAKQPKFTGSDTNSTLAHGWYGPGWDGGTGYFNPALSGEYNPYPYYNIVGGEPYGSMYTPDLPDQNESPFNPAAALTQHGLYSPRQMHWPMSLSLRKRVAQAAQPSSNPDVH